MTPSTERSAVCIRELFEKARKNGGLQYIYTLVRVEGITNWPDPIRELEPRVSALASGEGSTADLLTKYCDVAREKAALELVTNLLRCSVEQNYEMQPFLDLGEADDNGRLTFDPLRIANTAIVFAEESGLTELASILRAAYLEEVVEQCSEGGQIDRGQLEVAASALSDFAGELVEQLRVACLSFLEQPRLHKLPQFVVFELVCDDEFGLTGFRVHFSNGNSAEFLRAPGRTTSTNVFATPTVGWHAGDLDALCDEWRVGDRALYEVGLPGKYNALGEWKPIVYPGAASALLQRACDLSDDADVQGILFYMMCTGHRVIEFVVCTPIDLPIEESETLALGEQLHLWKCEHDGGLASNEHVYDGWLEVDDTTPETLAAAITSINAAINRLAFAYSTPFKWRLKYHRRGIGAAKAVPTQEDLDLLETVATVFPAGEDARIVEYAVDWYIQGLSSTNPFVKFLCFYIAIESVATAVIAGADLGITYSETDEEEKLECIRRLHSERFDEDPEGFVSEAYFECVVGLRKRTEKISKVVFGDDSPQVAALFVKREGRSLSGIRSDLAHGRFALVNRDEADLVKSRVSELADISHEFLMRVILQLGPGDAVPRWSGEMVASVSASDPRNTEFVTREDILPSTDWRIRPEWCE